MKETGMEFVMNNGIMEKWKGFVNNCRQARRELT